VAAIKMIEGDPILSAVAFEPAEMQAGLVVSVSDTGFAKKAALSDYPVQGRANQGVQALKVSAQTGAIAACTVANPEEMLDLVSEKGKRLRLSVREVPQAARAARGENITARTGGLFGGEPVVNLVAVPAEKMAAAAEIAPKKAAPKAPAAKLASSPAKGKAAPAKPAAKAGKTTQPGLFEEEKPAAKAKPAAKSKPDPAPSAAKTKAGQAPAAKSSSKPAAKAPVKKDSASKPGGAKPAVKPKPGK
jgi:hypothetical protein